MSDIKVGDKIKCVSPLCNCGLKVAIVKNIIYNQDYTVRVYYCDVGIYRADVSVKVDNE